MFEGVVRVLAKVWDVVSGRQVDELKPGVRVRGVRNGDYFFLSSGGKTKTIWLDLHEIEVTPPPADKFPPEIWLTIDGETRAYVPRLP